jgi:hypothetical protein
MQIYNMMTGRWECSCDFVPCKGKPCQAVMDYLSKLWGNVRQARLDFIGFYTTMIQEPRSDIMKELTYSRKMTNSCNLVSTNYFTNNVYTPSLTANYVYGSQTRLLSCTRAKDEIAAPDGNTCYGRKNDSSLTDDWLCCEQYKQNITPGKK